MEYRRDPVGKSEKIENGKKRTRKISGTRFFDFPKPDNRKYEIEKYQKTKIHHEFDFPKPVNRKYEIEKYQKTKIGNTKSRNTKNENNEREKPTFS